jgi:hypothetical protein
MPDFTMETAWVCNSNLFWSKKVGDYEVIWDNDRHARRDDCEYGWRCTCPSFKFRGGECKHIRAVKHERCGWNETCEPCPTPSSGRCPDCGGEVSAIRVAV